MNLNVYLFFDGRCAEALAFYGEVLGGKVDSIFTYGQSPMEEKPSGFEDKVMHASLRVGGTTVFASDGAPGYHETPQGFSVSLSFADLEEARRIFDALAEGGTVKMPFDKTFWAAGFGMLVDRFGTPWMINCETAA